MFDTRKNGFTLFEVIIAVALVAIMAVAIAPPIIKNLNEGKTSRAQSDAKVLGNAILQFYKDTTRWPLQNDADAAADLSRLAGNGSLGGGNNGIPDGDSSVPGARRWANWGQTSTLSDQLIRNATGTIDPLYTESQRPHVSPGWNGPYLDSIPLDPWGNPFVVNIRYMNNTITDYTRHHVMVLSAGPNGLFETPLDDATHDEVVGGDDIAHIVRSAIPN